MLSAMARILVTEKIAESGLDQLRAAGHEVDVQLGLDPEQMDFGSMMGRRRGGGGGAERPTPEASGEETAETTSTEAAADTATDPRAAIRLAQSYEPELIFLLSDNILGHGRHEIDQDELLAMFREQNPKTSVNTIQFLSPDPTNTMRDIAKQHNGTPKFITLSDLGLEEAAGR